MRTANLTRIANSYVESIENPIRRNQSDRGDDALRPGRYLEQVLGLRVLSVGLGYQDGYWASRFLSRINTRSTGEMLEWDDRTIGGWLPRNIRSVELPLRRDVSTALESGGGKQARPLWPEVVASLPTNIFGVWGPADPGSPARLVRLRGLFPLTHAMVQELGESAAFSFMVGSSPELGGMSPTMFVSRFSADRYELVLSSFARYLGGYRWQN